MVNGMRTGRRSLSGLGLLGFALAVLVAPAATVSLLTDKTHALFWGGGALGALGAAAGVLLSAHLGLAPGPVIVMLLGLLFLAAWIFSPRYGVIALRRQ
jgi:ABC-type Mn2+/Zn2+ transport system permease subunit